MRKFFKNLSNFVKIQEWLKTLKTYSFVLIKNAKKLLTFETRKENNWTAKNVKLKYACIVVLKNMAPKNANKKMTIKT